MMAIRDNPIAARAMGINVALYKTLTFGVSALYTGVAGALGAIVDAVRRARQLHVRAASRCSSGWWSAASAGFPAALFGGAVHAVRAATSPSTSRRGSPGAVYGVILILVIYADAVRRRRAFRLLLDRLSSNCRESAD